MRPIIKVENLSKQYRIGASQAPYKTIRETITETLLSPFNGFRRNGKSEDSTIWALKDVSFEVHPGEVVGIIGRNGAGKSTLLKILSRITEPTEGQAELYGRVGSLLEVGTGFHSELTGRENIYLNGAILGMRKAEIARKFDEIVAFAEMERFLNTPVKHYSSGMYMRLAFSVAAHLEPEILVVDEVLAVGDAAFQKKCLSKMRDVAREGRTVLFVSHNLNAVEQLCSSALLLEQGRITHYSANVREIIRGHLFAGAEVGASEWINDGARAGTPWFRPQRFFVSDPHGFKSLMPVPNNAEVWLQIEAKVEYPDTALEVGYGIYSEEGSLLYWSFYTDEAPEQWPKVEQGCAVFRTRIPPRLLNEGVYRIELLAALHCREWLFQPGGNVPSISLTIQGGLSDSPQWMVKRPGIFAPVLKWESRRQLCSAAHDYQDD